MLQYLSTIYLFILTYLDKIFETAYLIRSCGPVWPQPKVIKGHLSTQKTPCYYVTIIGLVYTMETMVPILKLGICIFFLGSRNWKFLLWGKKGKSFILQSFYSLSFLHQAGYYSYKDILINLTMYSLNYRNSETSMLVIWESVCHLPCRNMHQVGIPHRMQGIHFTHLSINWRYCHFQRNRSVRFVANSKSILIEQF